MVLFTDGLQNAGAETTEQVLPDLRANGVRVYTIGLGGDQDSTLLESVAATTGASYFPISGALPVAQAEAALTAAFVQIAGESRENGGVVAFDDIDGAGSPIDDDTPFFGPVGESFGETGERSLRFKVTISEGSTHATLGAMWRADKKGIRVRIYNPNGTAVPAGPQVRAVRGQNPYAFFEVEAPMPGTWEVEVLGSLLGGAGLRSIGFEVNNAVRLEASAVPHHPVRGETFRLRARLLSPHPVPDADITARIYSPAGAWSLVQLTPGAVGTAEEGLYTADVATEERFPGQYLIVVNAFRKAGTFTQQLDELYTLRKGFSPGDPNGRHTRDPAAGHPQRGDDQGGARPRRAQAGSQRRRPRDPEGSGQVPGAVASLAPGVPGAQVSAIQGSTSSARLNQGVFAQRTHAHLAWLAVRIARRACATAAAYDIPAPSTMASSVADRPRRSRTRASVSSNRFTSRVNAG